MRRYVVTPEQFEEELAYLKDNGFTSISFDDLVNHIENARQLPSNPVLLSFDDNWESQYRYGLPLLQKYGFKATFYIWVSAVGRKNHMTWNEIRDLARTGMQIGCHSMTHPYLTQIKDEEALQHEILGSKKIIEAQIKPGSE